MDLEGQVAVVTGAGSGIGKAIALALGARGATLALVGRREIPLSDTAVNVRKIGVNAHPYTTDLAVESELCGLTDTLLRDFEAIDILIHSAAIVCRGAMEVAKADDLEM